MVAEHSADHAPHDGLVVLGLTLVVSKKLLGKRTL
jgi:hypothetical protein